MLTVGVAVLPSTAQASAAAAALTSAPASHGLGPTVHAVPFGNTPAAAFSGSRRQLSGVLDAGTYVVLYTVGYADSRPREHGHRGHLRRRRDDERRMGRRARGAVGARRAGAAAALPGDARMLRTARMPGKPEVTVTRAGFAAVPAAVRC